MLRRELILGGLLTIVSAPVAEKCHAQVFPRDCILSGEVARSYAGNTQMFRLGREPVITKSGNSDFDFALAQTLSRCADVFEVVPGFAYFNIGNSYNAHASREAILSNSDGTVLFGRDLLFELLNRLEHPDAAVSAVCAHEFAHIVQFKNGEIGRSLDYGRPNVKRSELHADFLAGYFAGMRKLQRASFPAAVFAATQEQAGDNDVRSVNHHGRPHERAAAVVRGFETAYRERRGFADAIQMGINYVSTL